MLHTISYQVAEVSVYKCLGSGFEAARYLYRVPSDALVMTMRASQTLCNNDFTQRSALAHLFLVAWLQTRPRANPQRHLPARHYEIGLSWVG